MKRQKRESEKRCLCQWVPLLFNSQVATTQIYELKNPNFIKTYSNKLPPTQPTYCPRQLDVNDVGDSCMLMTFSR